MSKMVSTDSVPTITCLDAMRLLEMGYAMKKPMIFYGQPGIGKTSMVKQFCRKYGYQLVTLYPSQMDPVDVRGVPSIDKRHIELTEDQAARSPVRIEFMDKHGNEHEGYTYTTDVPITRWALPEYFPLDPDSKGVLFVDELLQAVPAVQHALMSLVLEREIGGVKLPEGWYVVAAGNRKEDGCPAQPLNPALNNRFGGGHYAVIADWDSFKEYAIDKGLDPRVLAYHNSNNGQNLSTLTYSHQGGGSSSKATNSNPNWGSPRTWEDVSDLLQYNAGKPVEQLALEIKGIVGDLAAPFITFCKFENEIPSVEAIIAAPTKVDLPDFTDSSLAYTVTLNLVYACRKDYKLIPKAFAYMYRFVMEQAPGATHRYAELGALFFTSILKDSENPSKEELELNRKRFATIKGDKKCSEWFRSDQAELWSRVNAA